jgi:HK97 family phage portal protein
MRWPWTKTEEKAQFEDVLMRLVAAQEGNPSATVTPENCMKSPTVHAIVTAISRRLSVTPIHVFRRTSGVDGESKQKLPNHPAANLLRKPNSFQSNLDFWQDATSVFVRHGRFYAFKSRGSTGPIRELLPIHPGRVSPEMDDEFNVTFRVNEGDGQPSNVLTANKLFHARGPARDFIKGDSPVEDVANTIALEIMAEKFGVTFFDNGAIPLLVFNFLEGSAGFQTADQEKEFVANFQEAFSGNKKHRGLLLPKGMAMPESINIDHDKAQFLETRKYQRTVIAGAFGVPPTYVGDLERATFNNVEQQSQDFILDVVLPVAKSFEAAMERDLLTDADRAGGVIIRFNLDGALRADFKSRQEGLKHQREMGVINANEWREKEGMNPRDGGDEYWDEGPSGQNMGTNDETEDNDSASDQESG